MSTIRSFIAVPLNAEIIFHLEKVQKELRTLPADVKWVNPQSIHLTLKFLGNIEEGNVEDIARGIQNGIKGVKSWSAAVRNMGAFPSLKNPRVIWIGIEDQSGQLVRLQNQIEQQMSKLGFEEEKRKFSAHLTLGRVRSPKGRDELVKYLLDERERVFGEIKVDRVILFKSELRPTGAVHTVLKEFTLR
ncbi:MAG TPA: RNA 2',3'-cyclic phosphodiesterase [Thermodesulfobacteriota bacterium]|nr:RNA 2',3'-cyclic phosphodiesterase [Thermodesulfobacteriota bacterium]